MGLDARAVAWEPLRPTPALAALPGPAQEAAAELGALMSELSEEGICASWILGNEEALWGWLNGWDASDFFPRWGEWHGTAADRAEAQALHEECGGWIVWEEGGPTYLPTAEWVKRLWDQARHLQKDSPMHEVFYIGQRVWVDDAGEKSPGVVSNMDRAGYFVTVNLRTLRFPGSKLAARNGR